MVKNTLINSFSDTPFLGGESSVSQYTLMPAGTWNRSEDKVTCAAWSRLFSPFFASLQSDSTSIWCLHRIWIFMANAQCKSLMRIYISGISTMPRSNWWCGLSAHWGDTGGTPHGSPLSQEGECWVQRPRVGGMWQEDPEGKAPSTSAQGGYCLYKRYNSADT